MARATGDLRDRLHGFYEVSDSVAFSSSPHRGHKGPTGPNSPTRSATDHHAVGYPNPQDEAKRSSRSQTTASAFGQSNAPQPPATPLCTTRVKSPISSTGRRLGIGKYHKGSHSQRLHSESRPVQDSLRKVDSSEDEGAFWEQVMMRFAKRTPNNETGTPSDLQSVPRGPQGAAPSPSLSPLTSMPRLSLLQIHTKSEHLLATAPDRKWASVTQCRRSPLSNETGPGNAPLFHALETSVPPTSPGLPACEEAICSVRSPSACAQQTRSYPILHDRLLESAASRKGAPSDRLLRTRSASTRRASISSRCYRLVGPDEMSARLSQPSGSSSSYLLLDLRPATVYTNSSRRLRGSMNISVPALLLKRVQQGNFTSFSLKSFLQDDESYETFARLCPEGRWQDHQLCIIDEEIKEADIHPLSGNSALTTFISALAIKQAEENCTAKPILILQGRLTKLVEHAYANGLEPVVEMKNHNIPQGEVATQAGIATSRLFLTPTMMTPSETLDSLTEGGRIPITVFHHEQEALPLRLAQAPPQAAHPSRRLRPLNLPRINTSGATMKSNALCADHIPGTSHPPQVFSSTADVLEPVPMSAKPPSAFLHTGFSAPSRLPAIAMPGGSQAAPQGDATFDVSVIIPGFLYLGPEPLQEEDILGLESVGIKLILNVAKECDTQERWRGRFEKITTIPMRDSLAETNVQERFKEACLLLDDADLHAKPTFVHCKAGKSRSVTIILAYLIHRNHWSLKRAYAHVLDRRRGVSPNIGFVAELMRFEEAELGGRSRGIFGSGCTPAHEKVEYFPSNRNTAGNEQSSAGKLAEPRTPRSVRSDLEGRPTVVRHLSFIANTAMGVSSDKPRTRDKRSSTHVIRIGDSMPPGLASAHHGTSYDRLDSDNHA